jgi:hypothetical protein
VSPDLALSDFDADARFRAAVLARGGNPDDPWIGGYAPYQWQRMRPIWEATMGTAFDGRVLEFGCNYGATAIVLATLGGARHRDRRRFGTGAHRAAQCGSVRG